LSHASAFSGALHVVIDAGLRRGDVAIVTIIVAYDRRRTSLLQAPDGFDQLGR
jgi:hypothetical protein